MNYKRVYGSVVVVILTLEVVDVMVEKAGVGIYSSLSVLDDEPVVILQVPQLALAVDVVVLFKHPLCKVVTGEVVVVRRGTSIQAQTSHAHNLKVLKNTFKKIFQLFF